LDTEGRPRFESLQQALGEHDDRIVYFVFDILALDGEDLRGRTLRERKKILARLVRSTASGCVRRVPAQAGDGAAFLGAARALGLEGILAKRADRPYRAGRSLDWQKVKLDAHQELVITRRREFQLGDRQRGRGGVRTGQTDLVEDGSTDLHEVQPAPTDTLGP
jgi:bifunctional non-homologous end joining protein LigD